MAVLTQKKLHDVRRGFVKRARTNVGDSLGAYTSQQINAAAQALEDWFTSQGPAVAAAIDSSGIVLTTPEKRKLANAWLDARFGGND